MKRDFVSLAPGPSSPGRSTETASEFSGSGVDDALVLAKQLGVIAPQPGAGSTRELWETLATLAAGDLGIARTIEPHLDAIAILRQADAINAVDNAYTSTWGVFAAEGGTAPLTAHHRDGAWQLSGTKPWCSLADRLDRALVTAHLDNGERALFAVELRAGGVTVEPGAWHARGLAEIPSGPVSFHNVDAVMIGEPGWYLARPGFAWGGIGVAACWFGGAVAIARTVFETMGDAPAPLLAAHMGSVDEQVGSARRALAEAAQLVDVAPEEETGSILAKRTRSTVASACESVILHSGHAMGPAPLPLDERHAKRVADLELYVRQHHAERDLASLGSALARSATPPW